MLLLPDKCLGGCETDTRVTLSTWDVQKYSSPLGRFKTVAQMNLRESKFSKLIDLTWASNSRSSACAQSDVSFASPALNTIKEYAWTKGGEGLDVGLIAETILENTQVDRVFGLDKRCVNVTAQESIDGDSSHDPRMIRQLPLPSHCIFSSQVKGSSAKHLGRSCPSTNMPCSMRGKWRGRQ